MIRMGVDVGGTFTDAFGTDGTRVFAGKSLTTPDNLAEGIINAIESAGVNIGEIGVLIHGSTIATNALITRDYYGWWPKTALVTTEGFRDLLEIRRGRNQLYGQVNMYGVAPKPLIERRYRFTIRERTNGRGRVIQEPDPVDCDRLIAQLKELNPDSIAICFINSFANPANELSVKRMLEQAFPSAFVFASCEVAPKFRELGRMVTVSVRALLAPIVKRYMDDVETTLKAKGFSGELLMIKGDGGTCTADFIKAHPEMLIGSGPAAGVYAGEAIGKLLGEPNCLTQDTGGTSYDVCMIENGRHVTTLEYNVDLDMPLIVPMTDVHSIGTGGGSIIWIDEGGSLRVGPQSAGAKPGPVCYGLGGDKPTVTDANLILNRIDPTLGGKMQLDVDAAKRVFETQISGPLGKDLYEAAEGALLIACANMARANALITTARGRDPRQFLPILFGGAGGMFACMVVEELGGNRAVVVPNAGVASAMGATIMPLSTYAERTFYMEVDSANSAAIDELNTAFDQLQEKVVNELREQGVPLEEIKLRRRLYMRYVGQNYELVVEDPSLEKYDAERLAWLRDAFNEVHQQQRGISEPKFKVAIVDIGVTGTSREGTLDFMAAVSAEGAAEATQAQKGVRPVYFNGSFIETPIFDFDKMGVGQEVHGPAVIEMKHSCTVVLPEWKARIDRYKNIFLERR